MTQPQAIPTRPSPSGSHLERHYSVAEVAGFWCLDESTIRRLFQDEPGVLKIGRSGRRDGKRDYVTLRIPESVLRRVHTQRCG